MDLALEDKSQAHGEWVREALRDPVAFAAWSGIELRPYQAEVIRAVVRSVREGLGLAFVVLFPRQSGKNEVQAQLEAYLLALYSRLGAELVKVSPTWKPQCQNAMHRLEVVLGKNRVLRRVAWRQEGEHIYRAGQARLAFFSGAPVSNVVGATATHLLECDEAQDVLPAKWDKDFNPMAAARNATRVFWGTAWTSSTLLARELRAAREAERQDGQRRVFVITADQVAQVVPEYGRFVAGEVAKRGRNHPLIKTQYFCEEIDQECGMFPAARRQLMRGRHARREVPEAGKVYALLVDVGGAALTPDPSPEYGRGGGEENDATALTVVEVDLRTVGEAGLRAPTYRVVERRLWVGVDQPALYTQLVALAEAWGAAKVVVDATGVGAGLAGFLHKALPGKVLPFVFSAASKSKLGWDFLGIVETGRFKDWQPGEPGRDPEGELFWRQAAACEMEVLPGPEQRLRWGVPDGRRDPETGERVHDDLLVSAALCALLDGQAWGTAEAVVVPARDPLAGMGEVF